MKMKFSPADTINNINEKFNKEWNKWPNQTQLLNIINEYFGKKIPNSKHGCHLTGMKIQIFFGNIKNGNLKCLANDINKICTTLFRKIKNDVLLHPNSIQLYMSQTQ